MNLKHDLFWLFAITVLFSSAIISQKQQVSASDLAHSCGSIPDINELIPTSPN